MQGKPSDIWSLGLILIELCTLKPIWEYEADLGVLIIESKESVDEIVHGID